MPEPTLRESLAAAQQQHSSPAPEASEPIAAVEESAPEVPEAPPEHAPESPEESSEAARAQRARDEAGRFAKGQPAAKPAGTTPATSPKVPAATAQAPGAVAPVDEKPPAGWKPVAREHWGKLPPEVRSEVARREREVQTALRETAEQRKVAQRFNEAVQPYRAIIGGDPVEATREVFQTVANLRMGTPVQKAAIVASIIQGHGVDINELAAALEGKAPQQQAQPAAAFRDPRFDQFLSGLQQQQRRQSEQHRAEAAQQLEAFKAKAEFLDDVREDMADIMERGRKRGKTLTLEQAYDIACQENEDVRPLWEQRRAAQSAANVQASTQRARAAASSVRHEPTAPAPGPQSTSLRDSIRAAAAGQSRRR